MSHITKIKLIFLLCMFCLEANLYSQCPPEGVHINNQFDVIKFMEAYPQCQDLNEGLFISAFGNGSTLLPELDLTAFNGLKSVNGDITISNLDLSGNDQLFAGLITVNGNINIDNVKLQNESNPFPSLVTIHGRLSLKNVKTEMFRVEVLSIFDGLYVDSCNDLKKLGFSNSCDQITDVSILNCLKLDDITEVDRIASTFERLTITDCPSLENCDIAKICELIKEENASLHIKNNGLACSYVNQVKSECTGLACSCPVGTILIESDEDLIEYQDLFGDCDIIEGNLTFRNFSGSDSLLTCFNSLKIVTGKLHVYGSNFRNFSFLDNIESIGLLEIEWCNQLENFEGLNKVRKVSDIKVSYCENLKSIGNLKLVADLQLQSLKLDNCNQLALDDIEFDIKDIDELFIRSATLTNFDIFSSLENLNNFTLANIKGLKSIELPINFNAKNITLRDIHDLSNVTTLASNFVSLESLWISNGDTDCSYPAFGGLEAISKSLTLTGFSIDSDIDLSSVQTVGKLEIYDNAQKILKEFVNLDSINYLTLTGGGLINLENIPADIKIDTVNLSSAPDLIDISALNGVLGLKSLNLFHNRSLESCSIDLICERDAEFDLKIIGFVPGCRNIEEVELLCNESNNIIVDDIILRAQSDVDSLFIKYGVIDTIFGNMVISGVNDENKDVIIDLTPLKNIKYIRGAIRINNLSSELIASLRSINFHELQISNKDIPLSLPVFDNVDSLFSLLIAETDTIIDDIVFPNLESHCRRIEIRAVESGSCKLKLPKLKSLQSIELINSSIEEVEIDNLEQLSFVNIFRSKQFKGFKNCLNLKRINELKINGSDSLEAVFDTTSNIEILRISISNISNIKELKGFENIEFISSNFSVFNNPLLERISLPKLKPSGFVGYKSLGIYIGHNPNLRVLDFPTLQKSIKITIENNSNLYSLAGFPSLRSINSLMLKENENIRNLDSLRQDLDVFNEINIFDNQSLNVCNSPIICNHLSASKPFAAFGNHPDCEKEIEMILSCGLEPNKCPHGDVLIADDTDIEYFDLYYNTCREIDGDLIISGELLTSDITFDSLYSIRGQLSVCNLQTPITIGFQELESVESSITIADNISDFELRSVKPIVSNGYSTRIMENQKLSDLSSFSLVSDREANVQVSNNPQLKDLSILSGYKDFVRLDIENNSRLKNLSHLNSDGLIKRIIATDNDSLSICDVPIICNNLETEYLISMTFNNNADSCHTDLVNNVCLGIVDTEGIIDNEFKIFPNPTASEINIEYNGGIQSLEIYDISGRLLLRSLDITTTDLSDFKQGNYILKLNTDFGPKSFIISKI